MTARISRQMRLSGRPKPRSGSRSGAEASGECNDGPQWATKACGQSPAIGSAVSGAEASGTKGFKMEDEPEIDFKVTVTTKNGPELVEIAEHVPAGDFTIAGFVVWKLLQRMGRANLTTRIVIEVIPVSAR